MSLISARLLRLEHARLSQRNGEETIERRYRQYLRIEPHIPSQRNASFIVRGYPTDHARSVRSTGAIGKWSYDSRRNSQGNDKRVPFVARWTDAGQGNGKTQTLNTGSIRRPAVRELNLTGSQLVVGCMCFLGAIRLVLWAVLKLWLFEP
jgi:hypothetical protein